MRAPTLISILILYFIVGSDCLAQLLVDAGHDTIFCEDVDSLTIGGNPTATGGAPPYSYAWSGSYNVSSQVFSASFMLEDTTVANPVFKEGAIPDSVVLQVTVSDANNNVDSDSINIRRSIFGACLGECRHYINLGDSVQLGHCVFGGITPYQFAWEPSETLLDTTVESPWAKPTAYLTEYTLEITDAIGCKTWSFCRVYTLASNTKSLVDLSTILIYPNPSSNNITVTFNDFNYSNTSFEILTLTGKIICRMEVNEPKLSINTRDYVSGIYLYRLKSNNNVIQTGKLVIE